MVFWDDPETVERFAARAVDHRLAELMPSYPDPGTVRVLDVGCAGGRNAVALARSGFDVYALDASRAMVDRTREGVAAVLGEAEAARRVTQGRMDDLSAHADGSVDLLLALGIFQEAETYEEWTRTLAEAARVLAPGGLLLIANFAPGSRPRGEPLTPIPGERFVYRWADGKGASLLDPQDLDLEMAGHGLTPVVPTVAVDAPRRRGMNVTVNGLYRRA